MPALLAQYHIHIRNRPLWGEARKALKFPLGKSRLYDNVAAFYVSSSAKSLSRILLQRIEEGRRSAVYENAYLFWVRAAHWTVRKLMRTQGRPWAMP